MIMATIPDKKRTITKEFMILVRENTKGKIMDNFQDEVRIVVLMF